jgi:iron complex transport system substrate-binding protein
MKRLLLAFAAVSLAVFAISCSDDDNGDGNGANGEPTLSSSTPANAAQATSASGSQTTYPLTVENCGTEFTFNEEPTTIATGYEPSFELVVGAGLADRIILTSQFDEIETAGFANPEQQAAYESVKHHDDPYYLPKKEAILALSPDVAVDVGDFSFKPEDGFATPDELVDAGIMPYKLGGWCSDESRTDFKIEILYNDVLTLGKIFNENAKAQQLVDQMKASFDGTKEKTEGLERPRVYMYDSGEGPLNSYGKGMSSIAVEAAGGDLIFKDQPWFWEASIEEVAASNPDAFVIVNYNPGATGEEKFEFLCTVVPDSKACKEKRYVLVPAVAFHPGYRFAFAVEDIARMLHPEAFE